MSTSPLVVGISLVLSTFFVVASVIMAVIVMFLGLRSMMENGVNVEAAPTLMVVIPLMTVLGIAILRQNHGLHVHFDSHSSAGDTLTLLSRMLSIEVVFALFGVAVLSRVGYVTRFVTGAETSAGSYALVCPGVALSVMTQFWINKGLVAAGIIAKFGAGFLDAVFPIAVAWAEQGQDLTTDELEGCRITDQDFNNERGPDAATVELTFKGLKLKPNGVEPLANPLIP